MFDVLLKVASFIVTLGILVTVHEFGHFIVARMLGVKVLRFSVGFGNPLWRRQFTPGGTEYVVSALPLGGYVKMLDEREGEVMPHELPAAFNRKPLSARVAVVLAGPLFNLAFAVLVFAVMYAVGVPGLRPVIGQVTPETVAARAGIQSGDEVVAVDDVPVASWEQFMDALLTASLDARSVAVNIRGADQVAAVRMLDMSSALAWLDDNTFEKKLGLSPWPENIEPVIGVVTPEQPAAQAGLVRGDRILAVNGTTVDGWKSWVNVIQSSPGKTLTVSLERNGATQVVALVPTPTTLPDGNVIGRIGAGNQLFETRRIEVRYGLAEAVGRAFHSTWTLSVSTLRMLGKMLVGEASLRNISGPIKIADVAGESVSQGVHAILYVLAALSVSLGVLNLLPIPILDGGHLLYYVVEFFTRRPVSEAAQLVGQRMGIMIIVALMGIAFFNDITGLLAAME
jgi:regulator of sigma E protease